MAGPSRGRRLLSACAGMTLGIAGALALCEMILRALAISYPQAYWIAFDSQRGWKQRPGISFRWREEGDSLVSLNSRGYRDAERPLAKPRGALRIAVLGDSMTVGFEVPFAQTWAQVLERALNQGRPGRRVEVLNFGERAYGTLQEWQTFRLDAAAYHPDLVVLGFFYNDLWDNSLALSHQPERPYLMADGRTIERDFRDSPYFRQKGSLVMRLREWMKQHSRLAQLAFELRTRFQHPDYFQPARARAAGSGRPAFDVCENLRAHQSGTPEQMDKAWATTRILLERLRDDVARSKARLIVVSLPGPTQAYPDPSVRARCARLFGTADEGAIERRLVSVCGGLGIPVLTFSREFQRKADDSGRCFHGFADAPCLGHFNPDGHRLLGEELAARLRPYLEKTGSWR